MRRLISPWIGFAACLAIVLAAMGWISLAAARSDRAEKEARRQTAQEQKVRLALWRIDTAMSPLLAQESARPYFVYRSFYSANRSFNRMFNAQAEAGSLIPSPLLRSPLEEVMFHFQFGPDGKLTSPELPTGADLKLATPKYLTARQVDKTRKQLAETAVCLDRSKFMKLLPIHESPPVEMVKVPSSGSEQRQTASLSKGDSRRRGQPGYEYDLRNAAVSQNANQMVQSQQQQLSANNVEMPATDISGVLMTPLWIDGRLILARRITAEGKEYVQGCLLDWPVVKASLLETIADLLPNADLRPSSTTSRVNESWMLASLPVMLVPNNATDGDEPAASPIVISLAVAWACVILAAVAVAALLWGVMRLSQRRATFVSAVTHELRTPLTTFQMYAEMLAEGMVPDVQQQRRYLETLRNEAMRLTHLVENVLAYARLERGRIGGRIQPIELGDLLTSMGGRLRARAEQSGMTLEIEGVACGEGDSPIFVDHRCATVPAKIGTVPMIVRINPSAVEQVLFNLVDNACKYAVAAEDKRIHLSTRRCGGMAEIAVRDHGPGISASVRRRLFRSFSKSAAEAAQSAPGIGLGLALSRRLARDMGGDLRLEGNSAEGTCFVLSLKTA